MKEIILLAILALSLNTMAQVPSYVPTNGLKGWWPFSGNANDASTNNNNGNVNGAALTVDRFGNINSAYSFNGTTDYIQCINAGVTGDSSRSVSFWMKSSSTSSGTIFSYGNNDVASQDFRCILNGVCSNDIASTITGTGKGITYTANNNWDFFTIVYDASISNNITAINLYKNGILISISCNSIGNGIINTGSANPITFGCYHWLSYSGNKQFFNGTIDDIGLWNRALTGQEVIDLYNGNICYQYITVTDTLLININTTGFNPVTYQNTIKIWPNPTNDHITIDNGNLTNLTGYQIKITNSLSQQVFQSAITQQFYVDLTTWTGNGIYFVHIIDGQGNTIDIRKIVLQ
jgi:hypothetical protein